MRGRRILLAEDSATQAQVLKAVFEEAGLVVDLAASGEEALAALKDADYDMVVSDVVMPGMSGYDLCRAIKARPGKPEIPVVLLTSLTDPMAIVRGLECGADNYVTKPFTDEYLLARLRSTLDRYVLRPGSKTSMGVNVQFLDTQFTITSDREQILDLFISSIEDVLRANGALQASQQELAQAQRKLEEFASRMAHQAQVTAEKYSALMHSASDAIFVLNDEGIIVEANARAGELFGAEAGELKGRRIEEFAAPESRDLLSAQLRSVAGLERVTAADVEFESGGGSPLHCDLSASKAKTRDGEFTLAILHDVTERRHLEQQLLQAQKMEAIGQLAGGVAHDFNNLLTVISSYVDFASDQVPEDSPVQDDLREIKHAADSATTLTRQLLAFSRKQVLQPRALQLGAVAQSIEKMLARLIGEHMELVLDIAEDDGFVMADPGQIEQTLMNLVVNARDAMPAGGRITISAESVEKAAGDSRFADLAPGSYEALSVTDTGQGMDAATRDRIFEPFYTTKPQGHGTGLGLSTVYGIVKQSGGGIDVRSALGEGTTLTILLPRVAVSATREAAPIASPIASRKDAGSVLLVEDDPQLRALTQRILDRAGFTVVAASEGEDALRICSERKEAIDLVLTDVVMPGMTAREMVDRLSGACGGVPILFMSGYAGDEVLRRGLAEPGMNFLQKPFTPESLLEKVRLAMARGP